MTEAERELDWLRWFYSNADFGPADGDVRQGLIEAYAADHEELPEELLQCEGCGAPRAVTREKAVQILHPNTVYRREREVTRVVFTCPKCDGEVT